MKLRINDVLALAHDYVKVSDVKAYDVAGGTFTQDAWRTRDINTEDSDPSNICSIGSNQITLEAGTYEILHEEEYDPFKNELRVVLD